MLGKLHRHATTDSTSEVKDSAAGMACSQAPYSLLLYQCVACDLHYADPVAIVHHVNSQHPDEAVYKEQEFQPVYVKVESDSDDALDSSRPEQSCDDPHSDMLDLGIVGHSRQSEDLVAPYVSQVDGDIKIETEAMLLPSSVQNDPAGNQGNNSNETELTEDGNTLNMDQKCRYVPYETPVLLNLANHNQDAYSHVNSRATSPDLNIVDESHRHLAESPHEPLSCSSPCATPDWSFSDQSAKSYGVTRWRSADNGDAALLASPIKWEGGSSPREQHVYADEDSGPQGHTADTMAALKSEERQDPVHFQGLPRFESDDVSQGQLQAADYDDVMVVGDAVNLECDPVAVAVTYTEADCEMNHDGGQEITDLEPNCDPQDSDGHSLDDSCPVIIIMNNSNEEYDPHANSSHGSLVSEHATLDTSQNAFDESAIGDGNMDYERRMYSSRDDYLPSDECKNVTGYSPQSVDICEEDLPSYPQGSVKQDAGEISETPMPIIISPAPPDHCGPAHDTTVAGGVDDVPGNERDIESEVEGTSTGHDTEPPIKQDLLTSGNAGAGTRCRRKAADAPRNQRRHSKVKRETGPSGNVNLSCPECGKIFKRADSLSQHRMLHTETKGHLCSVCGKVFSQRVTLHVHMRIHKDEKPYVCPECGKSFRQQSHYDRHARTHFGDRPFICITCNKSLATKYSLLQHQATHTGERRFVCHICEQGFAQKGNLKSHLRRHTGETPFTCTYPGCERAFASPSAFTYHQNRHKDERRFVCEDCGKRFYQMRDFKDHRATHLDVKPHQCSVCDKRYASSKTLRSHMESHTDDTSCSVCLKTFSSRRYYLRHIETGCKKKIPTHPISKNPVPVINYLAPK